MNYKDCKVICELKRSKEPLISKVPTDEFTKLCELSFDFEFNGESKVYPFKYPIELDDIDFSILSIYGTSGSGKTTLAKEFIKRGYKYDSKEFDCSKAVISNFDTPMDGANRLCAVGVNTLPTWCRPYNVLSNGEKFRCKTALNLDSYVIFDEFTSVVNREVAKSSCNSLQKYIRQNGLHNIVTLACHCDYIPYIQSDIVIDLNLGKVFDCRGEKIYVDESINTNKYIRSIKL